jgi:hypothetical protein
MSLVHVVLLRSICSGLEGNKDVLLVFTDSGLAYSYLLHNPISVLPAAKSSSITMYQSVAATTFRFSTRLVAASAQVETRQTPI